MMHSAARLFRQSCRRTPPFIHAQHHSCLWIILKQRSLSSSPRRSHPSKEQAQEQEQDHTYCVDLVRDRDREGYLCGLLMPASARKSYFAIRAFNVELAGIKDSQNLRRSTSSGGGGPMGGDVTVLVLQMRIRWWRDALDEIYNGYNAHTLHGEKSLSPNKSNNPMSSSFWSNPVVCALDSAVKQSNLTKRFLERLIDARELDLTLNQFQTVEDTLRYVEETVSTLLYLSLECTDIREDAADDVAFHAGVGIGLTTLLRAFPYRLIHKEISIPSELFDNVSNNFTIDQSSASKDILYESLSGCAEDPTTFATISEEEQRFFLEVTNQMSNIAQSYLLQAQDNQSQVPKQGRSCLLPIIPSLHYLNKLQQANCNVFAPEIIAINDDSWSRLRLLSLLTRSWATGVI